MRLLSSLEKGNNFSLDKKREKYQIFALVNRKNHPIFEEKRDAACLGSLLSDLHIAYYY